MKPEELLARISAGVDLNSNDAGIRISAKLTPAGGPSTKVFPPTYKDTTYVQEKRYRGNDWLNTVLLDAQQSQANRVEEALSIAIQDGDLAIPHLRMSGTVEGWNVQVTNLTAPHRSPDAYFRDAEDRTGTAFDKTQVGEALRKADSANATAFFEHVPTDLIVGFWDSQRGGRGVKIARSYTSEIIGWNPEIGMRAAGKVDPYNIESTALIHPEKNPAEYRLASDDEKAPKGFKATKPSGVGHGNIPPLPQNNSGVSISDAERIAYLSFAGLNRLRFPEESGKGSSVRNTSARTALACLAIYADRLAFARPSLLLRSGCELLVQSEAVQFVDGSGNVTEFALGKAEARALLDLAISAAKAAGFKWNTEPTELVPKKNLVELLAATFTKYAEIEE